MTSRLSAELARRGFSIDELVEVSQSPSISAFSAALDTVVRRLADDDVTLVFLLDEIEFLTPSDQVDTQGGEVSRLFGPERGQGCGMRSCRVRVPLAARSIRSR